MENLNKADLVPCKYYDYSNRGSVVAEVNTPIFNNFQLFILFYFTTII